MAAVRNTAINELKRRTYCNNMTVEYEGVEVVDTMSLDKLMILSEESAQLRKIWPHLPGEDQFILEGKYILGYSDKELAEQIKCKTGSIRMKLTRARHRALTLLLKDGGEYSDET